MTHTIYHDTGYSYEPEEGALPCGCVPHRTGTTEWGSFYCYTEKQGGYCNFECNCEEEYDDPQGVENAALSNIA